MILDIIRVIAALLLIFFLPGFFFIQALFPNKNELDEDDDFLHRILLSIGLSIIIAIMVGFTLGSFGRNPDTGLGYFQTPYIFLGLGLFCITAFIIGLYRGAYPSIIQRVKPEAELPIPDETRSEFYVILDQWRELKEKLQRLELRINEKEGPMKRRLTARRNLYLRKFKKIDEKLKELISKTKEEKSEAKKLHDMISEWKRLKEELHQCEARLKICSGELYERNKKLAEELKTKIENVEENITFLRDDSG